jgi:hypothetical protein
MQVRGMRSLGWSMLVLSPVAVLASCATTSITSTPIPSVDVPAATSAAPAPASTAPPTTVPAPATTVPVSLVIPSSTTTTTTTTTVVETVSTPVEPIAAVGTSGGAETTRAQLRLLELGFWLQDANGDYGLTTRQAVMAFQKYHGLTTDGVLGDETAAC